MRTLIESELDARDATNIANMLDAAASLAKETLESFDVAAL